MKIPRGNICMLVVVLLLSGSFMVVEDNKTGVVGDTSTTPFPPDEECTSVIVTGSCCEGGRAILMKNRDTAEIYNKPYYVTPGDGYYNYTMINHYWMGMNERGLAVENTAMPGGTGDNAYLNVNILKNYETVQEVWKALKDTDSPIGPYRRGKVGTCVGVIDRFGNGAYFEVDETHQWVFWVNNSFRGAANSWRHNGGDGGKRCARVEELLGKIYSEKGVISVQDVVQVVSRDVFDRDKYSACFDIYDCPCNPYTQAAFVAISGDPRYDGKLNCFWWEAGNPPIIGLYTPMMVGDIYPRSGYTPIINAFQSKKEYVMEPCGEGLYDPTRVHEVQHYTFYAENYTFYKYKEFTDNIEEGLSTAELNDKIEMFIENIIDREADVYINGIMNFPPEEPLRPSGPSSGKAGIEYNYSAITTDYDGDAIYFMFDWGDNTTSEWIGPYTSGEMAIISHNWTEEGNYSIRVKAKDENGAESDWSEPLVVSMPKVYLFSGSDLIKRVLEIFLKWFNIWA